MLHPGLRLRQDSSSLFPGLTPRSMRVSFIVNTLLANKREDKAGDKEECEFEAARQDTHPYRIGAELNEHKGESGHD